jgi:hypothetical protein
MAIQYNKQVTVTTRAVAVASAQSTAFSAGTFAIYIRSDVLCYVQIGSNPTATTAAPSIPIDPFQWVGPFTTGDGVIEGNKIAAIRDTVDGTLWIRETTGPIPS